jgi:hypothetical protein
MLPANDAEPVTAKVLDNVAAPVTPNVLDADSVVNAPDAAVVAPMEVLSMVEAAVGLMVNAPAGDMATVPVPVGDKVTVLFDPVNDKSPLSVVLPVTFKVLDNVAAPVTPSVLLNDAAFAIVVVAAVTVTTSVLSVMIAIDPDPVSVTVTAELPA